MLRPEGRALYRDWDAVARNAIAGFRLGDGTDPSDPRVQALLSRLLAESSSFAEMWSKNDARGKQAATKHFMHPEVGPIVVAVNIGRAYREAGGSVAGVVETLEAVGEQRTAEARGGDARREQWIPDSAEQADEAGIDDRDVLEAVRYYRTPRGYDEHSTNRRSFP